MSSPTKDAEFAFQFAMHVLQDVKLDTNAEIHPNVRASLSNIAWGLKNLSIGVRATYLLLEDVQRELRQLNRLPRP